MIRPQVDVCLAGVPELHDLVRELLGGVEATGYALGAHRLGSGVYRLECRTTTACHYLIAKRLRPDRALREQLVTRRWLPAIGASDNGPLLLGIAAERNGQTIWHVYEDLGDWTLERSDSSHRNAVQDRGFLSALAFSPAPERVRAVVKIIAHIHMRFAGHRLLGECRTYGRDLGASFFTLSVRDAIRSLDALQPPDVPLSPEDVEVRDGLLNRMYLLLDEQPRRSVFMADFGGPDTLLHGDLGVKNALVVPSAKGLQVRLIDWDHAGVGPVSYDLSTFLFQFSVRERAWILDSYREAIGDPSWCRLPAAEWNMLFDTAECARLAHAVLWPAIAAYEDHSGWAFDELASIEKWFTGLEPVLPIGGGATV